MAEQVFAAGRMTAEAAVSSGQKGCWSPSALASESQLGFGSRPKDCDCQVGAFAAAVIAGQKYHWSEVAVRRGCCSGKRSVGVEECFAAVRRVAAVRKHHNLWVEHQTNFDSHSGAQFVVAAAHIGCSNSLYSAAAESDYLTSPQRSVAGTLD